MRTAVAGFLVGALGIGAAVAGVGVAPVVGGRTAGPPPATLPVVGAADVLAAAGVRAAAGITARDELRPADVPAAAKAPVRAPRGRRLAPGTFLAGAARVSIAPTPKPFGGTTWQTEGCTTYGDSGVGSLDGDHLLPADPADLRRWPAASPDCVYLGGFGLGPVRPAQEVGAGGVWVRALAVSNGERTFVYAIADAVGWFARYDAAKCTDCGIRDVRERLARDLGLGVDGVVIGSTHSHATADTYGGWGGIPTWYRAQLRDSAIAAVKQAVANLRPAALTVGTAELRHRNNERRDTYRSNADTGATWLQARALDRSGRATDVIATWTTYAGHPTIVGDAVLHADWPGAAARRFEARYGGVGLLFEGGLGNVSISAVDGKGDVDTAERTGAAIADDVAARIDRDAIPLRSNDMRAAVSDLEHPAMTNPGLVALGNVGLFDREFVPGTPGAGLPGVYRWTKQPDGPGAVRGCESAGLTVRTTAGAHRIGELVVAFAPGEIFSNLAEVVKESADRTATTMVLGQTNDALGYIIQSFEFDLQGNALTEYGTQTGEYEEVFAIDRCFGDHVLDVLLDSTRRLGANG